MWPIVHHCSLCLCPLFSIVPIVHLCVHCPPLCSLCTSAFVFPYGAFHTHYSISKAPLLWLGSLLPIVTFTTLIAFDQWVIVQPIVRVFCSVNEPIVCNTRSMPPSCKCQLIAFLFRWTMGFFLIYTLTCPLGQTHPTFRCLQVCAFIHPPSHFNQVIRSFAFVIYFHEETNSHTLLPLLQQQSVNWGD
jgi:hypothetical protein